MSFGFGVSDLLTVTRLLVKLYQDYASAPAELANLAADLQQLQGCVTQLRESSIQLSEKKKNDLQRAMQPVLELLREMEAISVRYSRPNKSESRQWFGKRFPARQVQTMRERLHLQLSILNLHLSNVSNRSIIRMEQTLEESGRPQLAGYSSHEENCSKTPAVLQQHEIDQASAIQRRSPIKYHLSSLTNVEISGSQLDNGSGVDLARGDTDAVDLQLIAGPPTAMHLLSCICPGAINLQTGRQKAIKERKRILLRSLGAAKFELSCRRCEFHGFQDEPVATKICATNTPLFFCARKENLSPSSIRYYLNIHEENRMRRDGIYYRTIFFWKCHTPASRPTTHDSGRYECPFCPPRKAYGNLYGRYALLEHIMEHHVQNPPSQQLRATFNVYIDDQPLLFYGEERRFMGCKFDIVIPRALSRAEIMRAEHQKCEALAEQGTKLLQEAQDEQNPQAHPASCLSLSVEEDDGLYCDHMKVDTSQIGC